MTDLTNLPWDGVSSAIYCAIGRTFLARRNSGAPIHPSPFPLLRAGDGDRTQRGDSAVDRRLDPAWANAAAVLPAVVRDSADPRSAAVHAVFALLSISTVDWVGAWLAGDAVVQAARWPGRTAAIACVALYAMCQIPSTIFVRDWHRTDSTERSAREVKLREAVREIRRMQPYGPVFLTGLDSQQFWWGFVYGELVREEFTDLHVLPDAAALGLSVSREWWYMPDAQYSGQQVSRLLREGRAQRIRASGKSPPSTVPFRRILGLIVGSEMRAVIEHGRGRSTMPNRDSDGAERNSCRPRQLRPLPMHPRDAE